MDYVTPVINDSNWMIVTYLFGEGSSKYEGLAIINTWHIFLLHYPP